MSRKMSRLFKIIIPSGELLWSDGSFPHRPAGGHLTPFFPLLISPQRGCPFSFQSHPDLKCYCSRAKQQRPQDTFFGLRCGVWPAPQPTLMCQVRVISQSPVNPPFPLTNVIVSNGDFLFFWVQHETSPNPRRSSCRHCTRPQTQPWVLHGPAAFWTHDVGEGFIVQFFNQTHIWAYCDDFWL